MQHAEHLAMHVACLIVGVPSVAVEVLNLHHDFPCTMQHVLNMHVLSRRVTQH
jgi:hypothetical protein